MSRVATTFVFLLAPALLVSEVASAQARSAPSRSSKEEARIVPEILDAAARANKVAELEAWLRPLIGRFRVDGTVVAGYNRSFRTPEGVMECASIGSGPGLHCIINVGWAPIYESDGRNTELSRHEHYNTLRPGIMLFAVNSETLEYRVMLVSDHGIADTWSGAMTDGKVVFTNDGKSCWGSLQMPKCPRYLAIKFKPNSELIRLQVAYRRSGPVMAEFVLHRE